MPGNEGLEHTPKYFFLFGYRKRTRMQPKAERKIITTRKPRQEKSMSKKEKAVGSGT